MNFKTTLILILLLLVVVGFLLWSHQNTQAPDTLPTIPNVWVNSLLPDMTREQVVGLTIERSGKSFTATRTGDRWTQTLPVTWPLNAWAMPDLVNVVFNLRVLSKIDPKAPAQPTLTELKLDPPLAVLTLRNAGDKAVAHTLKLGKRSLAGGAYLQRDDDPLVYVVDAPLHDALLDVSWDSWRRRTLEVPAVGSITSLVLVTAEQRVQLARQADRWAFSGAQSGRADRTVVEALLGNLGTFSINRFVADNPSDLAVYGLDRPSLTLSIQAVAAAPPTATAPAHADDITTELRIGSPTDLTQSQYFATWTQPSTAASTGMVVLEISKTEVDRLRRKRDDFRDPQLTAIARNELRELTIVPAQGSPYGLLWSPEGWKFASPQPGFAPDPARVEMLIDAILGARAAGYAPLPETSAGPVLTLTLQALGAGAPEVVRFYAQTKATDHGWLAVRTGEPVAMILPADVVEPLRQPVAALRDREVWRIAAESVNFVQIKQPGETPLVFTRDIKSPAPGSTPGSVAGTSPPLTPGPWVLAKDQRYETTALNDLLQQVVRLRCEDWLDGTPKFDPERIIEVVIGSTTGSKRTLRVDPVTRLTVSPDIDKPFMLSPATLGVLRAELRDRTVLSLRQSELTKVTLTQAGRTTVIARDALNRLVDASGIALDQTAAAALLDTLASLRVERYLNESVKPSADARRLEISTAKNTTVTLYVEPSQPRLWQEDRAPWAVIAPEVHARLLADVTAKTDRP